MDALDEEVDKFNWSRQCDVIGHIMANQGYLNVNWLIECKHSAAQFEHMCRMGYLRINKKPTEYSEYMKSIGFNVIKVHVMRKKIWGECNYVK